MTNYTKILMHNSTADIEKRKGLVRNYRSALNEEQDYDMGLDKQKTDITEAQRDQQKKNREALTSSEKALANHDWYMHNKQWKKDYNAEYYQNNKDYWKRRMEETGKTHEEGLNYTRATGDYKNQETDIFENNLANLTSAEINYERAKKEYDEFMDKNNQTIKISRFDQPGGKSLIDKGVKAISAIAKPILGLLASLFH